MTRRRLPFIGGGFGLLLLLISLSNCATGRTGRIGAPEWFLDSVEGQAQGCLYLTVRSESQNRREAAGAAALQLVEKLMAIDELAALYALPEDRRRLVEDLTALFENPDAPHELPVRFERREWVEEKGLSAFFGLLCLPSDAADRFETLLAEEQFGEDELLASFMEDEQSYEENGLLYQAAASLLQAAAYVAKRDHPVSRRMVETYVLRARELIERIDIDIHRYPTRVKANSRVEQPFSLRCMEGVVGVRDVEFMVRYKGKKRNGSLGIFEVRIVSDLDGYVYFYHPFLPFTGEAEVVMSLGSRNVLTMLRELEELSESAAALSAYMQSRSVTFPFSVQSAAREVPMGIVMLHTDMTGSHLDSSETAQGLLEVLTEDGFDVRIMSLSPREITASNEASFLRDLKAAYGARYRRVAYGIVGINDFAIRQDLYKVETSGIVKVVDVQTGEILSVLEKRKSVESQDNALAMAASFRELGRAFAEDLKESLH